jgi:hypothetical protein
MIAETGQPYTTDDLIVAAAEAVACRMLGGTAAATTLSFDSLSDTTVKMLTEELADDVKK